jgi:hypothetical protein
MTTLIWGSLLNGLVFASIWPRQSLLKISDASLPDRPMCCSRTWAIISLVIHSSSSFHGLLSQPGISKANPSLNPKSVVPFPEQPLCKEPTASDHRRQDTKHAGGLRVHNSNERSRCGTSRRSGSISSCALPVRRLRRLARNLSSRPVLCRSRQLRTHSLGKWRASSEARGVRPIEPTPPRSRRTRCATIGIWESTIRFSKVVTTLVWARMICELMKIFEILEKVFGGTVNRVGAGNGMEHRWQTEREMIDYNHLTAPNELDWQPGWRKISQLDMFTNHSEENEGVTTS